MAQPKLIGLCNQCGHCCMVGELRCENLILTGTPGEPMASACSIYTTRYPGMPILMFDKQGRIGAEMMCGVGMPAETDAILERGIGKGCSLTVVHD